MKLPDFKLLADENIDPQLILFLRNQGFDVKDVHNSGLVAAKDIAWLRLGKSENRVIVTQDHDFGKLVFTQPIDFIGIVFLRPGSFFPDFHLSTLQAVIAANLELVPPFILTAENRLGRIRIKVRRVPQ